MGGGEAIAAALGVQPDGKILVAGTDIGAAGRFVALARYHTDGNLDWDFGAGGKILLAVPNDIFVSSLALSPAGHVSLAGSYTLDGVNRDLFVMQFLVRDEDDDALPDPWA